MISVGRHNDIFFIKAEHQTVTATAAITKDEAIKLRDYLDKELAGETLKKILDLRNVPVECLDHDFPDPSEWLNLQRGNMRGYP
jgi:hypothetical protein